MQRGGSCSGSWRLGCTSLNEADSIRRFVREALPLLSSYVYSEQVELEPTNLQIGLDDVGEFQAFAGLLRMRHALACGLKFKPIVDAIKRVIHNRQKSCVQIRKKQSPDAWIFRSISTAAERTCPGPEPFRCSSQKRQLARPKTSLSLIRSASSFAASTQQEISRQALNIAIASI